MPGVRLRPRPAAELAESALDEGAQDWAGPSVRALGALVRGIRAFVEAGLAVPALVRLDGDWHAGWRLAPTPETQAWLTESATRCHGLVTGREELGALVDALVDATARERLGDAGGGRRSALGAALVSGGEPVAGGPDLADVLEEFGRAVAATRVGVVFRIVEPGADPGAEESEQKDEDGEVLWRLETLVRVGSDALRPLLALDDPGAFAEVIEEVLDRAERAWTPLAGARRADGGTDLLLPTPLVLELVDTGVAALRAYGVEVLVPRAWTRVRAAVRVDPRDPGTEAVDSGRRLGVDQLADVDWSLVLDEDEVDADELRELLESASDLVRLRGRWVRADTVALRRAARFLERHTGARSPVEMVAALASEEAAGVEVVGPPPSSWPAATGGEVALPDWFGATLRPYQEEGLRWMSRLADAGVGAVLADDMGLGKTVQVLALLAAEHHRAASSSPDEAGPAGPTLVVAPLTLLATWEREAARFAAPLRVHVHHGAGRRRGEEVDALAEDADLVLTSYGTVARDLAELSGVRWRRVVADEAQTIKNPSTAVSRALCALPAAHRIALTGTPVENRLDELRAVLDFANPGLLGSASTFRARFAVPVESHRDEAAAARLRTLAAPFVLRRVKSDPRVAADLPDKRLTRVDSPLTREQGTLYKAVVEEMMEQVKDSTGTARKGAVLAGLTALKQVCNHPAHYLADASPLMRDGRHRSGKIAALDELLARIVEEGEKALVFTQYRAFGELILPLLSRRASASVPFLHGGVSAAGRAEMVRHFQRPEGPSIMLASLKAGGTGLTLTEANHVVHLDRWWNPAVENQATDRVHRIGQTRTVRVHTMVSPGTVEDRIDEVLDAKRDLADLAIGPLAGRLTELDDAALAELVALAPDAVVGS